LAPKRKSLAISMLKNKKRFPTAWRLCTFDVSQNDVKKRNGKTAKGTNARKKTKVLEPFETFSPER